MDDIFAEVEDEKNVDVISTMLSKPFVSENDETAKMIKLVIMRLCYFFFIFFFYF